MRIAVIGAGIIGAACAFDLTEAGCEVLVIDRGHVGAGTTSRGEGNILVSDKAPGPELDLALISRRLWSERAAELGADRIEFDTKGGLVVSGTAAGWAGLTEFAATQAAAGVRVQLTTRPTDLEPHLSPQVAGGAVYPDDAQVQPVLATQAMLQVAVHRGARLVRDEVLGAGAVPSAQGPGPANTPTAGSPVLRLASGDVVGVDLVVNAAGTWGGEVAGRLGAPIEILPRRGFILVTQPMPAMIRHKVYSADYVANVASSDEGLETSTVVEGTRGGTVLIGASRERVGFDATMSPAVVRQLAQGACTLFPFLRAVQVMRVYRGFRPYCRDHLPMIGPDPRAPWLIHACGHEGAGIGLAAATGALVTGQVIGRPWRDLDPADHVGLNPGRLVKEVVP